MVKKRSAFTFVEVILALGMLIAAVSVVAHIQLRSLLRVTSDRDEIEKVFLIKKELYKIFLKFPKRFKKTVLRLEESEIAFATQEASINAKSSLAPLKDRIKMIQIQGNWKRDGIPQESLMVALVLNPEFGQEEKK